MPHIQPRPRRRRLEVRFRARRIRDRESVPQQQGADTATLVGRSDGETEEDC